MYECPITEMVKKVTDSIIEQRENAIVAQISEAIGLEVDKQELIKALQYDRQQYEKGYADAKAEFSLDERVKEFIYFPDCFKTDKMKQIEAVLGFRLFYWQWDHILHNHTIMGRRCGKTLAECIRALCYGEDTIELNKYEPRRGVKFMQQQLLDIKERFDAAGIQTAKIVWL